MARKRIGRCGEGSKEEELRLLYSGTVGASSPRSRQHPTLSPIEMEFCYQRGGVASLTQCGCGLWLCSAPSSRELTYPRP